MMDGGAGKKKALMTDSLLDVDIECLQRRLKGPDKNEPPPPLSQAEGEAPEVDLERLRMLGGPFTAQVIAAFESLLGPGETESAAFLFAKLDQDLRRDVEVLGLIRYAASNDFAIDGAASDVYECVGPDGAKRAWLAPRILVSKGGKQPIGAERA